MGKKPNAFLQELERKYDSKYKALYDIQLDIHSELNLMAHIIACDDDFELDEEKAGQILNGFLETKLQIADSIVSDDKDLVYSKYDIARRLKQIFGPEGWKKYCQFFPLLKEYWDA